MDPTHLKENSESEQPYLADQDYQVRLTRPILVFGVVTLAPLHEHVMRGSVLLDVIAKEGSDVIESATATE